MKGFERLRHLILFRIPGLTVALVGGSVISFKYSVWSMSLWHYEIEDNFFLYAQIGLGVAVISWAAAFVYALIASFIEWGNEFRRGLREGWESHANREPDPDSPYDFMRFVTQLNEAWDRPRVEPETTADRTEPETTADKAGLTVSVSRALHHYLNIPFILAFHLASFGGSYYSFSVIHIVIPTSLWVALIGCAALSLVGITLIVIHTYALMRQEPDAREQGESATDFVLRKVREKDDW